MDKAKKRMSIQKCFVVILLVQVLALVGWCIAKKGYFVDEIFTYGMCNSEGFGNGFYYMYDDYLNNWHDSSLFHDYLTVQQDGRFDFRGVVENVSADVHPPIYFMIIHVLCSLMPDVFTKWFGLLPNIAFFVVTQLLLYLISVELFGKEKHMVLVPVILYGFSVGAINSVTLIRAYMMLAMLCTLQFYIHVKLWRALQSNDRKQETILLIVLACSTCVGFLTQYYYVIFAFFISAAYSLCQMVRREWKHFCKYAVAMFGGLGLAYVLFPMCYQQILGKEGVNTYRGEEAFENLKNSNLSQRLSAYIGIIDQELFGGMLKYAAIIGIVAFIIYIVLKHVKFTIARVEEGYLVEISKKQAEKISFNLTEKGIFAFIAAMGCLGYAVILSKIAAYETDRYIFCIYPLIILCFCYMMQALSSHFHWKNSYYIAALLLIFLTGYSFEYNSDSICYLYSEDGERYARFDSEYAGMDAIYVTTGMNNDIVSVPYLEKMGNVYAISMDSIPELKNVLEGYTEERMVVIVGGVYWDFKDDIMYNIIDNTEFTSYEFVYQSGDIVYVIEK